MRISNTKKVIMALLIATSFSFSQVKIGLNYPETGPYAKQGLDQLRAAELALEEINASGGILGQKVEMVKTDSKSKAGLSTKNVTSLIDKSGVKMVFGGSSSGVAVASGKVAQKKGIPFFGTLTYSTATTGKEGRRFLFRECYDSWMAAKALSVFLNKNYRGKKFFYITADYTWGWTTEESFRKMTQTMDSKKHGQIKTKFPGATQADFEKAIAAAEKANPDVLVLVLFGYDMAKAVKIAAKKGMNKRMQIVVPNLTLGMAEAGGAEEMEGVIGALPWSWNIPYKYGYEKGKKFVENFAAKHNRYPSTSGASAYTILHEYKAAVERAKSFDGAKVVKALEGHKYTLLKDTQVWRGFDHQSVQSVYAVKCKPASEVNKDKFKLDYFEILKKVPGSKAAVSRSEWISARKKAGKPIQLEKLPGE